ARAGVLRAGRVCRVCLWCLGRTGPGGNQDRYLRPALADIFHRHPSHAALLQCQRDWPGLPHGQAGLEPAGVLAACVDPSRPGTGAPAAVVVAGGCAAGLVLPDPLAALAALEMHASRPACRAASGRRLAADRAWPVRVAEPAAVLRLGHLDSPRT